MTIVDLISPAQYELLRETARASIAARGAARGTETDEDDGDEDDDGEAWDSE